MVCLLLVGCSEHGDPGEGPSTTGRPRPSGAAATVSPKPTTTVGAETTVAASPAPTEHQADPSLRTAMAYTGGPGGVAQGEPMVVGYVNQEGGVPAFPEATTGVEAAVDYVNNRLGGAGGRPLALARCAVQVEADGARCGLAMVADDRVQAVVVGAALSGNQALLDVLRGRKPVFLTNPVTTPDLLATDAYAFNPGPTGVIQGVAVFTGKYLAARTGARPREVAVVHPDSPAGRAAYEGLVKPILDRYGIAATPVVASGGADRLALAIQQAGAIDADAFVAVVTAEGCIDLDEALRLLSLDVPVVTGGGCSDAAMAEHLARAGRPGVLPDGWYEGGYGYSTAIPGYPEGDAYVDIVERYTSAHGVEAVRYDGLAGPAFAHVMTLTKLVNAIGGANVSPEAIRAAARGFGGPQWGVVGPMACGRNPLFTSLCGMQMGIEQHRDGAWVPVMDGHNRRPIDLGVELGW